MHFVIYEVLKIVCIFLRVGSAVSLLVVQGSVERRQGILKEGQ
jgi:hypothetical protein